MRRIVNATGAGGYDPMGNRWAAGDWYSGSTNRVCHTQCEWDGALAYDAGNRMVTPALSGTARYWYDGEGGRVKKQVGTGAAAVYVYDVWGQLAGEYGGGSGVSGTHWVVGRSGQVAGLDYFGARYMSSAQGRFTSPDLPFIDQHPEDPQSWNLYSYGRNNPLAFVDPTGHYVCGKSMGADECANFQKSLDQAQVAANALKDKYGEDSRKYTDAQRAIDVYGAAGVKNGVTINTGATDKGGSTAVAGAIGPKTADNPTGQNINVTFSPGLLSGTNVQPGLVAHEGYHAAQGSDWVASGFSMPANPTNYQTEFRAYQVQAAIGEDMGGLGTMLRPTSGPFLLSFRGWSQDMVDARTNLFLRQEYHLTPGDVTRAFHRMVKVTK